MHTNRPYCCGNCPFFHPWRNGDGTVHVDNKGESGQCRKHAPKLNGQYKKFPEVALLDFCGDHPSGPLTRTQDLLAQIASRMESPEERAHRNMHVPPDAQPTNQPHWMNQQR